MDVVMAATEPTVTSSVELGPKSFILPVIGALLLTISCSFIWCEYTFQQERATESGLVVKKLCRVVRTRKSTYRDYYLLCQPMGDANLKAESPNVWLLDRHSHWDIVKEGQTIEIAYRKAHPSDMRLATGGILESPYVGFESWGFWALVGGIIASWVGWRPLAGPLLTWFRGRMGVVNVSP
jgi:hypothetical protein